MVWPLGVTAAGGRRMLTLAVAVVVPDVPLIVKTVSVSGCARVPESTPASWSKTQSAGGTGSMEYAMTPRKPEPAMGAGRTARRPPQ